MESTRPSFDDHSFRRPLYARLDICARGARPMGFMPENRFGAGGKRGFCWSQRQAGLAVQPFFGLGFRLRWSGRRWRDCPYSGMESVARARVLSVLARVLPVLARVLPVLARVLSMNLGESAQIGEFGKRHHRVFRHSRWRRRHGKNKDILE